MRISISISFVWAYYFCYGVILIQDYWRRLYEWTKASDWPIVIVMGFLITNGLCYLGIRMCQQWEDRVELEGKK